jgi:hypothetical protein
MWALAQSGVCFRAPTNDDGTLGCWQRSELPPWEVPKRDPREPRPRAPEWRPEAASAEVAELSKLNAECQQQTSGEPE